MTGSSHIRADLAIVQRLVHIDGRRQGAKAGLVKIIVYNVLGGNGLFDAGSGQHSAVKSILKVGPLVFGAHDINGQAADHQHHCKQKQRKDDHRSTFVIAKPAHMCPQGTPIHARQWLLVLHGHNIFCSLVSRGDNSRSHNSPFPEHQLVPPSHAHIARIL